MRTQQKALIVMARPDRTDGLDELNLALQRGWRVAHVASMGGAGVGTAAALPDLCFAALVVLEWNGLVEAEVLEQAEELPEEALDPLVDGDGAGDGSDAELGL